MTPLTRVSKPCRRIIFIERLTRRLVFRLPLSELVKHSTKTETGLEFLQKKYDTIKTQLKDGEKILNENLEELGVKL